MIVLREQEILSLLVHIVATKQGAIPVIHLP